MQARVRNSTAVKLKSRRRDPGQAPPSRQSRGVRRTEHTCKLPSASCTRPTPRALVYRHIHAGIYRRDIQDRCDVKCSRVVMKIPQC